MAIGRRFEIACPPGAFRLALAAMVVVSHISRFDVGRLAVLFFFYLSGYWTAVIWEQKFAGRQVGRFYAARYLRIAPLYLLVMGAAAIALGVRPAIENLTLLGVASSKTDPLGISWSLDIELQYYLLVPFLIPLLRGSPWIRVLAALLLAGLGWLASWRFGVVNVLQYLPTFVLGALTYNRSWKPSAAQASWSLVTFVAMSGVAALTPFVDKTRPDPFDRDLFGFLWMLPLLPYVARSLQQKSGAMDRHLGNLSYPLYLVHYVTIVLVGGAVGQASGGRLLGAGVAVVLALAIYLLVDRPIDRWRVRLTEGPARDRGEALATANRKAGEA